MDITILSGRGLSTRRFHRLPPTAIVDRQHVPRRPNKYVSRRSFIRCRWSETLEQPANLSSPAWSEPWSISTSTQDASVSGCMTAALSDYLLFQRRYINILTYLLTYLLTCKLLLWGAIFGSEIAFHKSAIWPSSSRHKCFNYTVNVTLMAAWYEIYRLSYFRLQTIAFHIDNINISLHFIDTVNIQRRCVTNISTHRTVLTDFTRFYNFYLATCRHSADYAVARCLSVCLSVCHTTVLCLNGYTYHHSFSLSGSPTTPVSPYQTGWRHSDGESMK